MREQERMREKKKMKKEERHRHKMKKENKKKFLESDDEWQNEDVKPSTKYFVYISVNNNVQTRYFIYYQVSVAKKYYFFKYNKIINCTFCLPPKPDSK